MNVAQFTRPYLEKWLTELAGLGYDAIIWEVENNIRWESCPECTSPDAFSKDEFRQVLDHSRRLGLEPIPLFQTIAHCEYVLKHDAYRHLAEMPGEISQYCPRNPDLLPFLARWMEEYLDVFGKVRYFHVGADEAWWLGKCPRCRDFVAAHSLSQLYVEHVNAVSEPLRRRGITPIIWADMVLHRHEAIDALSRDIMLFDWIYSVHRGDGKVQVWDIGLRDRAGIPPEALKVFGKSLFPLGDEPARDPETFYTADFLAAQGFRVVTCPAASSYGDNVFSPRNWYHMVNTFDSFRKGMGEHLHGSVLTSWTVHLFPYELQLACIAIPGYLAGNPRGTIEEFQQAFVQERFGLDEAQDFFRACGLLSKSCLFTHTSSLGFGKDTMPVPLDWAARKVQEADDKERAEAELNNCTDRLQEYRQALGIFERLATEAPTGHELLDAWLLAARNLINRAEAAAILLERVEDAEQGMPMDPEEKAHAIGILAEMRALKEQTRAAYSRIYRPGRCAEAVGWMFDSVEHALAEAVGG
jgi:hypothetical protein